MVFYINAIKNLKTIKWHVDINIKLKCKLQNIKYTLIPFSHIKIDVYLGI